MENFAVRATIDSDGRCSSKECFVAEPEENGLVKSVESLLADKQAIAEREKRLLEDLNAALGQMGYRVVPSTGPQAARKPGRPPGSGKGQAPKAAAS